MTISGFTCAFYAVALVLTPLAFPYVSAITQISDPFCSLSEPSALLKILIFSIYAFCADYHIALTPNFSHSGKSLIINL